MGVFFFCIAGVVTIQAPPNDRLGSRTKNAKVLFRDSYSTDFEVPCNYFEATEVNLTQGCVYALHGSALFRPSIDV